MKEITEVIREDFRHDKWGCGIFAGIVACLAIGIIYSGIWTMKRADEDSRTLSQLESVSSNLPSYSISLSRYNPNFVLHKDGTNYLFKYMRAEPAKAQEERR